MRIRTAFFLFALLAFPPAWPDDSGTALPPALGNLLAMKPARVAGDEGIRFACKPDQTRKIERDMAAYLAMLGILPNLVVKKTDRMQGVLVYTLNTPPEDSDTLDLIDRPELGIKAHEVRLPARSGRQRKIQTVSKKEIMLALLQHGRLTEFKGAGCHIGALKDHVAIRQNTVAWAEKLEWSWPDGESAEWNRQYWSSGTPRPGFPLHIAVNDAFMNPGKYSIGCYTAAKLVMIQGVLDYYRRIRKDPVQLKRVEDRLSADREPLAGIEPGRMWDFEADFDPRELERPGKLLQIQYGVAPKNFVPGDWAYFVNTDLASARKTGYEGSNPIYLGRNRFADYFNDNDHSYTCKQKLDEVFQWRNGVFSRHRDAAKIQPLSEQDFDRLTNAPAEGGLVADFRAFPLVPGEP